MFSIVAFLGVLFISTHVLANPACPVCTIAIGASLTIARKFGVDDCVVAVWAGAFLAILGYWAIRWFDKKNWHFKGRNALLMALSVSMVGFVYIKEITYDPVVIGIFYMDSFLFSTLLGALLFIASMHFYEWMKAKNGGHAHFPFEKVVLPLGAVLVLSILLSYYPLCNCRSNRAGATEPLVLFE